jgi:hypothetical protein
MKKSENILREALGAALATFAVIAVVGVGIYIGTPSTSVADRTDLSQYATFDVYPARAERVGEFYVNSRGLTVGSDVDATTPDERPDLIAVVVIEGETGTISGRTPDGWISGFVLAEDLYANEEEFHNISSLEEAERIEEARLQRGPRNIPVYDFEGEVVIGAFEVW